MDRHSDGNCIGSLPSHAVVLSLLQLDTSRVLRKSRSCSRSNWPYQAGSSSDLIAEDALHTKL